MAGFVVRAQTLEDGEWWLLVETTADRVGCPACGCRAVDHGRRDVQVRDMRIAGRPVRLVWAKRLWRCPDPDCGTGTWSETSEGIRPRASLTERARAEICRRVGEDGDSVAAVAREFGVAWPTAMAAVVDHGTRLVDDLARLSTPGGLGVDETVFLAASPIRRRTMITGFVDLDRHQLLDVTPGRSGQVVRDWLDQRAETWLAGIGVAVVGPFRG
jgi:transposase